MVKMDKRAVYNLTYGLFVLAVNLNGKDNACIINTAVQVTSEPNRISIAVNKANLTHDMLMYTKKFCISILSEEAEFSLFQRFGFHSGKEVNKFEDFRDFERDSSQIAYVTKGANACISATVEQTLDLGTHTLFIAKVTDMKTLSEVPSATYAYYQNSIKPKPEKSAEAGKTGWRCTVCGYVYEGEEIPEDFICPLCKHPAADFEKIVS